MNLVDRYRQLLAVIPSGQFYDATGMVVPFRSSPYTVQVNGDGPNIQYGVFVNGNQVGIVTSGVDSKIVASVTLQLGDNKIEFFNTLTGKPLTTFLTTRHYATWLAALAEVIGSIDEDIERTMSESRLATATQSLIGRVFGTPVYIQNDFNYGLEAFRLLLEQVRYAYRYYGGTNRGIADIVRAFTQVSPLIFDRRRAARTWKLGSDLLWRGDRLEVPDFDYGALTRRPAGISSPPSSINAVGAGLNVVASRGLHRGDQLALTIYGSGANRAASIQVNGGPAGLIRNLSAGKVVRLVAGSYPSMRTEPLYTASSRNITALEAVLSISINNGPWIEAIMPTGASVDIDDIVTAIDNAITSSPHYGPSYSGIPYLYDPAGLNGTDQKSGLGLRTGPVPPPPAAPIAAVSSVRIRYHDSLLDKDFSQPEFNVPYVRAGLDTTAPAGDNKFYVKTDEYLPLWPNVDSKNPIYAIFANNTGFMSRWNSPLHASKPSVSSPYERVQVVNINKATGQFDLSAPLQHTHDLGSMVYLEGTDVIEVVAETESTSIDLYVHDPSALVNGTYTVTLGITPNSSGEGLPRGMYVDTTPIQPSDPLLTHFERNFGSFREYSNYFIYNFLSYYPGFADNADFITPTSYSRLISPFVLARSSAHTVSIIADRDIVKEFAGYTVKLEVWYSPHNGFRTTSFSREISAMDMTVVTNVATFTVVPVEYKDNPVPAIGKPYCAVYEFVIPVGSNSMRMDFVLESTDDSDILVHSIKLYPDIDIGVFLGYATRPQSAHTSKTGSAMLVWSPTALTVNEESALGLVTTTQDEPASIDRVSQAHSTLQKFDVTTYDLSGDPTNLYGAWTDVHFNAGTRENLTIVPLSPAKFSYIKPDQVSINTVEVQFNPTPPHNFTLPISASQNYARSILTENGIPVPQDQWQYNSATQIQLLYTPLGNAKYVFEYEVLHRFTSVVYDLGASVNDKRLYFADYHVFSRPDFEPVKSRISTAVSFDILGNATLRESSNLSKDLSTLRYDRGFGEIVVVPNNEWQFTSANTISISPAFLVTDAVYTLEYEALVAHPKERVEVKMEYRTATSIAGISSAPYVQTARDQKMVVNRYVQLRLSLSNVRNVDDAKILSLSIRQLSLLPGTIPVVN